MFKQMRSRLKKFLGGGWLFAFGVYGCRGILSINSGGVHIWYIVVGVYCQ